jgi:7-cyano-7-deazaguanine synthase
VATSKIIVLSSGGLRSLVAIALARSWPHTSVAALHLSRPGEAGRRRRLAAREQAAAFERCPFAELAEPSPDRCDGARLQPVAIAQPLPRGRLLILALAHAAGAAADAILWPASFNGDVAAIARASEQITLARHLASTEMENPPVVESPLLEFTDRQIIEIGAALDVPGERARSCELEAEQPCGQCPGCRRRRAAFDAARMVDPLEDSPATLRQPTR